MRRRQRDCRTDVAEVEDFSRTNINKNPHRAESIRVAEVKLQPKIPTPGRAAPGNGMPMSPMVHARRVDGFPSCPNSVWARTSFSNVSRPEPRVPVGSIRRFGTVRFRTLAGAHFVSGSKEIMALGHDQGRAEIRFCDADKGTILRRSRIPLKKGFEICGWEALQNGKYVAVVSHNAVAERTWLSIYSTIANQEVFSREIEKGCYWQGCYCLALSNDGNTVAMAGKSSAGVSFIFIVDRASKYERRIETKDIEGYWILVSRRLDSGWEKLVQGPSMAIPAMAAKTSSSPNHYVRRNCTVFASLQMASCWQRVSMGRRSRKFSCGVPLQANSSVVGRTSVKQLTDILSPFRTTGEFWRVAMAFGRMGSKKEEPA
jgi:hypothetical protein